MTFVNDFSVQFQNLMPALGLGFLLGLQYDTVRIIRLFVSNGKIFVFITDVLYCLSAASLSYLLFLSVNNGHIRFYLVLAMVVGAVVYSCTAGEIIFPAAKKIAVKFRRFFRKLFSPVAVLGKNTYIKLKNVKINKNKLKKLLKRDDEVLYNNSE